MGTRLDLRIEGPGDRAWLLTVSEAVLDEVRRFETLLSTWDAATPLSQANRAPVGEPYPLSPHLRALLETVLQWSQKTGGAFEPRMGALVQAWDMRGEGRVPGQAALAHAVAVSGDRGMTLTPEGMVRRDPEAWLDAGGFGKGTALDAARGLLIDQGVDRAHLNFGGQLLLVGTPPDQPMGWPVSVAHPGRRGEPFATLRVGDASVATSGASERTVDVDGGAVGHILDPRTGQPVPAWGSVTVVAGDPLAADILSTALFVLGPDEGMSLARSLPDMGVLFLVLNSDGGASARWNDPMERWLVDPALHTATHSPGRTTRLRP
jgi:thiamine biosynthesis lipoprotein